MSAALKNLRVLVTRPSPKGELLCHELQKLDANPIFFPTLQIEPIKSVGIQLDEFDWVIFISPNAVSHSIHRIKQIPKHVKVAAIGSGTAAELKQANWPMDICPSDNWSSDGLLKIRSFQNLTGQRIAIIKGIGGRKILSLALKKRGGFVKSISVYRRILPHMPDESLLNTLRTNPPDVIICTSSLSMLNLKKLLAPIWAKIQESNLLVISERLRKKAISAGFKKILTATSADNAAILETLKLAREGMKR